MIRIDEIKPQVKLWLSMDGKKGGFGIGKWKLLAEIERKGSLSSAAHSLGISYRKAWNDLKESEEFWNVKLIEKHRGGSSGGDTMLTQQGRILVEMFGKFYDDVEKTVNKAFERHILNNFAI